MQAYMIQKLCAHYNRCMGDNLGGGGGVHNGGHIHPLIESPHLSLIVVADGRIDSIA